MPRRRRDPIAPPVNPNLLPGEQVDFRRAAESITKSIADQGIKQPRSLAIGDGRQRAAAELAARQAERADDVAWYKDQLERLATEADENAAEDRIEAETAHADRGAVLEARAGTAEHYAYSLRMVLAGKTFEEDFAERARAAAAGRNAGRARGAAGKRGG